jgi:hypothetical protein
MDVRFGTWNVRDLYKSGSVKTLLRELKGRDHSKNLGVDGSIILK